MKETNKGSWLWRKLLKLRPLVSEFMRCDVRNGESIYFWYDDWLGTCCLIDKTRFGTDISWDPQAGSDLRRLYRWRMEYEKAWEESFW